MHSSGWDTALSRTAFGSYGRMFPDLPACPHRGIHDIIELGALGGRMDDTDNSVGDNTRIPAGFSALGQFITHDVSFDASPMPLGSVVPDTITNRASPRFDLDNVYGGGVGGHTMLYPLPDRLRFALGDGGHDMPRMPDSTVISPDPRDDNNLPLSQLHLAFMRFHNAVIDALLDKTITTATGGTLDDPPEDANTTLLDNPSLGRLVEKDNYLNHAFAQAQRLVTWHYQWMIVNEYLPLICDPVVLTHVLETGPTLFPRPDAPPFIPVEFTGGAFRYAHAVLRNEYRLNDHTVLPMFVDTPEGGPRVDLRGGTVAPEHAIDWSYFFHTRDDREPQYERLITTRFPTALLDLPVRGVPGLRAGALSQEMSSLAVRDLCRSEMQGIPSGQDVATALGYEPLTDTELGTTGPVYLLWYVLREAELHAGGQHLGPVGSRIVAETILGLLDADPWSYRSTRRHWTPTIAARGDKFGMADIVTIADTGTVHQANPR